MTKSLLKLAKEFQGRSYDAMIAHKTIVYCRYIMLALEKRKGEDNRTIEFNDLPEKISKELISKFIAALPLAIKGRMRFSSCES